MGVDMKRVIVSFFVILLISTLLYAQDSFKIGSPLPLTGAGAAFGEKFKKAYQMAIDEINKSGGINGKKLELFIEDTQAKPTLAVTASKKLLDNDKVVALVGGWSSGVALAVAPFANENKIPYLLEHPALDDITRKGYNYVFRLQPTTGMYSAALENFLLEVVYAKEKRRLKTAYLYVDNAFGQGVAKYGILNFMEANKDKFDLVMKEAYDEKALDYKPIISKLKSLNPDIIILTSYLTDGILLAKQFKELGVKTKVISGTGAGHSMQDIYEKSGGAVEGYFTSGPWHGNINDPKWKEWRKKWESKYGYIPGEHEIEGYVAIYVLAEALKSVKANDIETQRQQLRDALSKIDINTIFGRVKFENFNGYTNQNKAHALTSLSQWQNGKLLQVWPKEIAETNYK